MSIPGSREYELGKMYAHLAALEDRCARLERSAGVYVERVRINSVGGTMVVVAYPNGGLRAMPYISTYSPVVNDQVLALNSPQWSGVIGKVSA